MTAHLRPGTRLEIEHQRAQAELALAASIACGDESDAEVARDRLADLADVLRRITDRPRLLCS